MQVAVADTLIKHKILTSIGKGTESGECVEKRGVGRGRKNLKEGQCFRVFFSSGFFFGWVVRSSMPRGMIDNRLRF
jgi:hypothetical protein